MKIKSIKLKNFKRFTDLKIKEIPETAKLVMMIGPNGCGKSSVFEALDFYTYIVKNDAYPSDDVIVGPYEPMHMTNYYLKNNVPRPILRLSDDNTNSIGLEKQIAECKAFMVDCKGLLSDCVNIILHSEQGTKVNELRVHTRSSLRNYSLLLHSDLFSTHSAEKLRSKLSKLPTEKEEDHTFGLNHWALFPYKLTYDSELGEIFKNHRPEPPDELKNYAETVLSFKAEIIEEVGNAMVELFTDPVSQLILYDNLRFCLSLGDPETVFLPDEKKPPFFNLSVGEIAIFDLVLDIAIQRAIDDETVLCIDEPELHIHTKLQGQFLEALYNLISPKLQLWIATHSIGMVRKAQDLWREDPDSVVFLDFSNRNFDEQVTLKPITPDPDFWARTYEIALGDMAELVVTERTVFCEGEEFDAGCYKSIFESHYPETRFISLGGWENVEQSLKAVNRIIGKIAKNAKVIGLIDGDTAIPSEIKEDNENGIRTLSRSNIEGYLLDDEVLIKLCKDHGKPDKIQDLLNAKQAALKKSVAEGKSPDDLKPTAQRIHTAARNALRPSRMGRRSRNFMRDILAPLIQPGMKVYEELHEDIFGE